MKKKIFAIIFAFALVFSSAIFLSAEDTYAEVKTFTVTKREANNPNATEESVGEYETLFDAMGTCEQEDLSNEYIVTLNKNYTVPEDEDVWSRQNVNILLRSAQGSNYTIKRLGTRLIFYVSSNCKMKTENIILDGNEDGELTFLSENGELTLDKGTVVQNFIDIPSYDGPAIYLTGSSTLNIEDGAIIQKNKGNSMGGVIGDNSSDTTININGGTFTRNSSVKWGGVIGSYGKVTINGGTFTGNTGNQGAVVYSNGALNLNAGTFEGNQTSYSGGVIAVGSKANLNVSGGTFKGNSGKFGSAIYTSKTQNAVIQNAAIESNVSGFGAVYFNEGSASVENVTFNNNLAINRGSAIYNRDANVAVNKSTFKYNGEMTDEDGTYTCVHGGAIAVEKLNSDETKLTVVGSTFEGNKAEKDGGAIHTSDSNYANTVDTTKDYQVLNIDNTTVFKNNTASGYFNPPENVSELSNINAKETSFTGTNKIKPDSPLNNYDINYKRDIVVTYDPNNGGKVVEEKYTENTIENYEIKSNTDLKITSADKFLGWARDKNATKADYNPGDKIDLNGNLYLYAIWEKTAPKPSENVTLTLDENYLGGKITTKTLKECGEVANYLYTPSRDGYVFLGWNYKKDGSGDLVKATDTICKDTSIYAIWEKITPEPERRVHEYVDTIPVFAQADSVKKVTERASETHIQYISGYPDNTVRADGNVTRAEAVTMLVRLKAYPLTEGEEIFKDVKANAWYAPFISAAYKNNILEEKKGQAFRPDEKITRAELAQLISHLDKKNNAKANFPDIAGHKFEAAINQSFGNKRIAGYPDGSFRPDNAITRAETARILNSLFDRKVDSKGLAKVMDDLRLYRDLDKNHWAYYEIMEASHTHQCERDEKGLEVWTSIIK